jgi:hypothetical protein
VQKEIHGDQDCPVVLTVSATDARRNELAKIAWRARMESGELPLIFLSAGPADVERLAQWTRSGVVNSGQRVRLIELRSHLGDNVRINLAHTDMLDSDYVVACSLPESHGFAAPVTTYKPPIEFQHPDVGGWQLDLPESLVDRPEVDDDLSRIVRLVADVIRHGCGASTIASDIPDYFALLAAFNVTDRGSLTREINRRIGMPPGIGIEFYAQPLEDGDWDTWIGAGGQGDGFNFPTSIARTLECARSAFDDYVGDHYRDLKFDEDWYPPEPKDDRPRQPREDLDHFDLKELSKLFGIAYSTDPRFALACLGTLEEVAERYNIVEKLVEYAAFMIEVTEDEAGELSASGELTPTKSAEIDVDHAHWTQIRNLLDRLRHERRHYPEDLEPW